MINQKAQEPERKATKEMSAEDFMATLRRACQNSGRSAGRIASIGGLPRSTAYRFVAPDNTALPKYRHQLRDFLQACGMPAIEIHAMLRAWDRLTGRFSDPTPVDDRDLLSLTMRRIISEASDLSNGQDSRTDSSVPSVQTKASQAQREKMASILEDAPGYVNRRRPTDTGVRARGDGLWVATADGDWVRADQIVRIRCDRKKVVLHLNRPPADGVPDDHSRTEVRCRSAVEARKTADDIVYMLAKYANTTGTVQLDSTGQMVAHRFSPRGITTARVG